MRNLEPHTEAGNPAGPSAGRGHDPVSRRAAIAAKARKNPKKQFNNLLHHLTYELAAECLDEIPRSSAAGVDGMSVKQARENLSDFLVTAFGQLRLIFGPLDAHPPLAAHRSAALDVKPQFPLQPVLATASSPG
jgi:hypothetical protein